MKKLVYLLLFFIVLLGGFLRLYNLSGSPPSLNWDEAAWGYNAYSILKTGRDEYKKPFPIFTRSFDEYKSTLPMYLMTISIRIFGLNEVAVRFPSALMGTASIVLIYLLAKIIFEKEAIALTSSFLFAIEPWSVHFARVYHDGNIALFFLLLGTFLFLLSKRKNYFLLFSLVSFGVSMFTYNANKLLVPLFVLVLTLTNRRILLKYPKKIISASCLIGAFFLISFIIFAILGQALARVSSTNIFILWPKEGYILHRIFLFVWDIIGRYFSYFSPYNLFLREPQEPATIVAGNSIFYPFEFIPVFVGLFIVLKNIKKYQELASLILISPLPAILTWNWFQPGRAMALFSAFSILGGFGTIMTFVYLQRVFANRTGRKLPLVFLFIPFIIWGAFSAFYLFDSINVYLPLRDAGNWQPGFKETVPVVMDLADKYDKVVIETPHAQPYIFYLFYGKYPPQKYQTELDLEKIGTPRKVYDFGKFEFRKIYWPTDRYSKNTLFVGNDENLPDRDLNIKNVVYVGHVKDASGGLAAKLVGTSN